MSEYLAVNNAAERSHLEAQQRAAGLREGDVTQYWHGWITHPLTGQEALVINNDADKEYLSASELSALLSQEDAEDADWFLTFEPEDV